MTVESGQSAALRCANHPNVETHLRCSRCGKPICVKCVYQTPVGGRCRECANLKKSPILVVSPARYARAAVFGLVVAIFGGFIWASLGGAFGLSGLLLVLLGYLVGEAVSRGAEGRISRGLQVMVGLFTLVAILTGRVGGAFMAYFPDSLTDGRLASLLIGAGLASLFGSLMQLLFVALAIGIAVSRIR